MQQQWRSVDEPQSKIKSARRDAKTQRSRKGRVAGNLCFVFALVALTACSKTPPINPNSSPALLAEDVQYHVNYLASDELEGRMSGTPGGTTAAAYLAAEFQRFGLEPSGDEGTFYQNFDFFSGVELGLTNELRISGAAIDTNLRVSGDFIPAGYSASVTVSGEMVFAGYGIAANDLNYDDYADLEVAGKLVMILRMPPGLNDPHSGFAEYEPLRRRALLARERNVAALLVVDAAPDSVEDTLPPLRYDRVTGDAGIPVVFVKRSVAALLLAQANVTLDSLPQVRDNSTAPHSFAIPNVTAHLHTELRTIKRRAANVVGVIPGDHAAELREQVVVLGAHYDHLGRSSEGALDADSGAVIRNGADDNASGTAGLLELAQYFSMPEHRLKRTVVFAAFAAEELGLLGSSHFVENPPVPFERIVTMINMDMIGRLKDRKLIVNGTGTSPSWPEMLERLNAAPQFDLRMVKDGQGPSDHASFYKKDIPVLFFFTDLHDDYHRASDDAEKINAAGEAEVLEFIATALNEVANADTLPTFTKAGPERATRGVFRVSVGTIPDYAADVVGVKLSGVRSGGPAAQAGLQAGDIIIKFGEIEIKNIYDYTYALGEFTPGQEVPVTVNRNEQELTLVVKLAAHRRM